MPKPYRPPVEYVTCPTCLGTGYSTPGALVEAAKTSRESAAQILARVSCGICHGTGKVKA